jgi:gluconate 2-dehydrogenase gamma chain
MSTLPDSTYGNTDFTRREAIKRAALFLGVALSPSLVRSALAAAASPTPQVVGKPLGAASRAILAVAAERILPRTDTPGAVDVGVPAFIELLYGSYMSDEEKSQLDRGVQRMDDLGRAGFQRGFTELAGEQQDAVLRKLSESADAADASCFQQLRQLTVVGYFTSKTVGTTVLQYDPVPARYQGDIPLSEVGKSAWYMS